MLLVGKLTLCESATDAYFAYFVSLHRESGEGVLVLLLKY